MVLNDFQRGKLPYYYLPPGCDKSKLEEKENTEFIEKLLEKQEKIKGENPTEDGVEDEEAVEEKSQEDLEEDAEEDEVEESMHESKGVNKTVQKLAEKKNKLKAAQKKSKIGEIKGKGLQKSKLEKLDKKKLKNWNLNKK